MKRFLLICCLCLVTGLAHASLSLAGLRFVEAGFAQCGQPVAAAPAGQPRFALAQLEAQRHYCLVAEFDMPGTPAGDQLLFFSALAAGEFYLDGSRIGINGVAAARALDEVAGNVEYWVSLTPGQLRRGRHQLQLKLSTYHGAPTLSNQFYAFRIEDQQAFRVAASLKNLLPVLLAGALALVAFIFLGLVLFYQRTGHWIVFLLLCVSASLLLLVEAWRSLAGYAYSLHIVRLYLITGLTGLFAVLLPLYFLIYYRFRQVLPLTCLLALLMATTSLAHPYFDVKAGLMFLFALLASAVINLVALRQRRSGSKPGLAVVLLALGVYLLPGLDFAETGFAIVVFLLLLTILFQLLAQFAQDRNKAALATQLENQLLRRSLQPHFLMNSLSLVGELVHQSPAQAEKFIQALGSEFRMLSEYANRPTISLAQELELCHNYLEIMSTRMQKTCVLAVTGDPAAIALPPAVLLTSLENAFSHNKYRHDLVIELRISAHAGKAELALAIPVANPRAHLGTGTGSHYIRQSLHEAFAGKASFAAELAESVWRVRILLPR